MDTRCVIKGAIFDVDGVLLDSMAIWEDVAERYLMKLGYKSEPGLRDILFTMTLDEGAEYIWKRHHFLELDHKILLCSRMLFMQL